MRKRDIALLLLALGVALVLAAGILGIRGAAGLLNAYLSRR